MTLIGGIFHSPRFYSLWENSDETVKHIIANSTNWYKKLLLYTCTKTIKSKQKLIICRRIASVVYMVTEMK